MMAAWFVSQNIVRTNSHVPMYSGIENQPKENHFKEVDEKSLLQILLFLQDKKKSYDLQTFEKQNDKC